MATYEFPPLHQPTWVFYVIHIVLAALAIGTIFALLMRSGQPARGIDVVPWLIIMPMGLVVAGVLNQNEHVAPFAIGLGAFVAIVGVTGLILTTLRCLTGKNRPQTGAAIMLLTLNGLFTLLLLPATPRANEAARQTQCRNNLRFLGLGFLNAADQLGALPPAVAGSEKPRSWRVDLLPFVDEKPRRARYDDSATWDSPANLMLAKEFVHAYDCPSQGNVTGGRDAEGRFFSAYAAVTGAGSAFSDSARPLFPKYPDGASQTLLLVEACGQEIVWTEPRDVDLSSTPIGVNLNGTTPTHSPGLGSSYHAGGFQVLMAGGNVRFLSQKIDPDVLRKLATAEGGETVEDF